VREFFRSLIEKSSNITINTKSTNIYIGGLQLVFQQNFTQVNNINIILLNLREVLEELNILYKQIHQPTWRARISNAREKLKNTIKMLSVF